MRHLEPNLTAKVYTDSSQLPTSDAVNSLPGPLLNTTDSENYTANDPQESVKLSPMLLPRGKKLMLKRKPKATDKQCFSPLLAPSGNNSQMVGAIGLAEALPQVLRTLASPVPSPSACADSVEPLMVRFHFGPVMSARGLGTHPIAGWRFASTSLKPQNTDSSLR